MKNLIIIPIALFAFLFISCSKDEVQKTQTINLQIDGYDEGGSSTFVETTTVGEEIAITLGPVNNTFKISNIQFLFGGTGTNPVTRDVILKIYKDNGTVNPDNLLFSGNYTITASNTLIQEIDVRDENITLNGGGSIRIAFELVDDMGLPSFAQEFDGTYFETKNWIKESNGTWNSNDVFGLNGNWVIRATVEENI